MKPQSKKVVRTARQKSKLRIRKKISGTDLKPRVSVFKSAKHTYAQVVSDETNRTLVSASTKDADVIAKMSAVEAEGLPNDSRSTKSVAAARAVGLVLGDKLKAAGVGAIVFDRNGFRYHGRVQGVADGIRATGMTL
jgi:large subunit ribosomal protein L18